MPAAATAAALVNPRRPDVYHSFFPASSTLLHAELAAWMLEAPSPPLDRHRMQALAALTPDIARLGQVADDVAVRWYTAGTRIVSEGDPGDGIYLVLPGEVTVGRTAGDVFEAIARKGPGEFFGEIAVVSACGRTADVVASTDVTCLRLGASPQVPGQQAGDDGRDGDRAIVTFDVASWLSPKLAALREHRTQFPAGGDPLPVHVLRQVFGVDTSPSSVNVGGVAHRRFHVAPSP